MTVVPDEFARSFTAEDLSPTTVELFLRGSGWRRVQLRRDVSAVWENAAADASVMVPHNRTFRDYRQRLTEALITISDVHGIRHDVLPVEIASARNDVLFLRADQLTLDGTIPLPEARAMLEGVERLLLAAACSAVRPKAWNPGKRPAAASEFVHDDVRMGHTLSGSFVMTIFAQHDLDVLPAIQDGEVVADADDVQLLSHEDTDSVSRDDIEPFTRRVMTTLASGIDAARELLDPSGDVSIEEAVQRGASFEMVQSIGKMGAQEGLRALDMSFLWSPSCPREDDSPDRVVVPRPDQDRVERVSASLKQTPPIIQDDVVGQVIRLDRAEGKDDGVVVVEGYLGRTRRRIRMNLSGEAYRTAIHAHERRTPIVAHGEVALVKRSWWLVGPVDVRLPLMQQSQD